MYRKFVAHLAFLFLFSLTQSLSAQEEIPNLRADVVYLAFRSDHEGEREHENEVVFESEPVYILPLDRPPSTREDMLESSTRISPLGGCRQPAWNKQGNRLAYFDGSSGFDKAKIIVVDFFEKTRRELDTTPPTSAGISWNADGNKLVYVGRDVGICIYDTKNRVERVVLKNPECESTSISPDGEWIVFMTRDGERPNDADGWRLNLLHVGSGKHHPIGKTNDHFGVVGPFAWTSDGQKIATRRFRLTEDGKREYQNYVFELEPMAFNEILQLPDNINVQEFRFWRTPE